MASSSLTAPASPSRSLGHGINLTFSQARTFYQLPNNESCTVESGLMSPSITKPLSPGIPEYLRYPIPPPTHHYKAFSRALRDHVSSSQVKRLLAKKWSDMCYTLLDDASHEPCLPIHNDCDQIPKPKQVDSIVQQKKETAAEPKGFEDYLLIDSEGWPIHNNSGGQTTVSLDSVVHHQVETAAEPKEFDEYMVIDVDDDEELPPGYLYDTCGGMVKFAWEWFQGMCRQSMAWMEQRWETRATT